MMQFSNFDLKKLNYNKNQTQNFPKNRPTSGVRYSQLLNLAKH